MNIEVKGFSEEKQQPTRLRWPISQLIGPKLAQDEVHLWCVQLNGFSNAILNLWKALSDRERKRAQSFRFQKDRNACVIRWGLLRHLLSRYTETPAAKHRFITGPLGKPESLTASGESQIFFNMSHSGSMALYAFTRAVAVGVDIEWICPMDDLENIANDFFAAGEKAALLALPHPGRLEAFFNCWTRKEAILKATGQGISEGLDGIEVSVAPGEPARVLSVRGDAAAGTNWSLHALHPATGYAAALAYQGPALRMAYFGLNSLPGFTEPVSCTAVHENSKFAIPVCSRRGDA